MESTKPGTAAADPAWRARWEPIFRAAERGQLPNRAKGVLEMAACILAFRRSKVVSAGPPR